MIFVNRSKRELIADLYVKRGEYSKGLALYLETSPDDEQSSVLLNKIGFVLYKLGHLDKASELLGRAIEADEEIYIFHHHLGLVNEAKGKLASAVRSFKKATELNPNSDVSLLNLATLLKRIGGTNEAKEVYRKLLTLRSPYADTAEFMLANLEGNPPAKPPVGFIENLFDHYADKFEHHLCHQLNYDLPTKFEILVREQCSSIPIDSALDLGCGTGLCGVALDGCVNFIDGVDVSSKMLRIASQKKVYRHLFKEEITCFLRNRARKYDLVVAADVLIYFGELESFFEGIKKQLSSGGIVVCSTESLEENHDFTINESFRYKHSPSYVLSSAEKAGLVLSKQQSVDIRKENGCTASGFVFCFRNDSPAISVPVGEKEHSHVRY